VRNARVLMRAVATALRTQIAVPSAIATSLVTLAAAVDALAGQLVAGGAELQTRTLAVQAAAEATAVLAIHHDLRTSVIIGQIRATAVDLLRASGMDGDGARDAIPSAPAEEM
jgi:hypothetical protein